MILGAEPEPADSFLVVSTPFRYIDVEYRPKTVAMKRALHFGRDLLLEGESEERLFVSRKANAFWRESRLGLRSLLGAFNSGC